MLLSSGCPEMLEDDFVVPEDEITVPGGGGSTSGGGVGGTAGTASGGGAAGTGDDVSGDRSAVLSTLPADGARGVLPDTALVFTFDSPMDTGSVEAAYDSIDVPKDGVFFVWSDGDTVLEIQPEAPLQAAAGTDPSAVAAIEYSLGFTSQAKDKLGHALVAKQISFSVARSITQSLNAVQNRDLTGNWRSDSTYGIVECERADVTICVGDGALTDQPDPEYKALLTFDLSALPSDVIDITGAEVSLVISNLFGTPFSSLGSLRAEHVEFSGIGDQAFTAAALSTRQLMSSSAAIGDRMSVQVLTELLSDWPARSQSQYRLAFDTASDEDDAPDHLVCSWDTARLDVSYWLP